MKRSPQLGFGGFLLGLGIGWITFRYYEISGNVISWLLILAGAGIIISALISWSRPKYNIGGLAGGLIGGLILSLFITSGFGLIGEITSIGVSSYRAKDTKSYNGAVTLDKVYLDASARNGFISVSTWSKAEYKIDLTIKAKTKEDLEDLKIDFEESETQSEKRLSLGYTISPTRVRNYAIDVEVFLPADAIIKLDLSSSNGGIYLKDIDGEILKLDTSNGPIQFDNVFAERISGDTSNAKIEGILEAPETELSTSNAMIDLTLPCSVTGDYLLKTSNSALNIEVSSNSDVGYDLDLSTSNGNVNIDLPNLSYTTQQKTIKRAKTTGFDTKEVKITIRGSTSNSNIDVET